MRGPPSEMRFASSAAKHLSFGTQSRRPRQSAAEHQQQHRATRHRRMWCYTLLDFTYHVDIKQGKRERSNACARSWIHYLGGKKKCNWWYEARSANLRYSEIGSCIEVVEGFPPDSQGALVFMEGSRLTMVAGRRNFGFKESTQHSHSASRDVKVSRQLNYNTTTSQNLPLKFTPPVPCLPVWYQRTSLAKWKRAHPSTTVTESTDRKDRAPQPHGRHHVGGEACPQPFESSKA